MKKQYVYSTDTDFLKLINKQKIQDQYVKITLLDWNEDPLEEIQGLATGGSESINGNSAVRRTCNLSMLVKDEMYSITDVNNLISINKKIFLEVGVQNRTIYYPEEAIIWFPQGTFIVNSCNISHSLSGISISLQLKDKMCLLNGECGGIIPASTQFDEWETIDDKGNILISKPRISQIIRESINHFGGEQLSKILISDIDDRIKSVVKWTGNTPLYLVKNNGNYQVTTDYQEISDMESTTGTFDQDTTSFNSSSDFKIDNIKIDGKSTQETRSGKNKIDYTKVENGPSTTATLIENGFKINGSYAGTITIKNLKKNTDYYLQYSTKNIVGNTKQVAIFPNETTTGNIKIFYNGTGGTFNTGEFTTITIWFYGGIGSAGEVDFTNIQLEQGTVATSYEPYGVMPSPDYPSEIECVKGINLLKGLSTPRTDTNYWNSLSSVFTPLSDGWGKWEYDNTSSTSTSFMNAMVNLSAIDLKPNTTYTFVVETRNSTISENSNAYLQIITNNATGAFKTGRLIGYQDINENKKIVFNSVTKDNFNGVTRGVDTYLRLGAGTKGTVEARISLFEYGNNTSSTYVPYNCIQSKIVGKNLVNPTLQSYTKNGVTFTKNGDGTYILNGTSTAGMDNPIRTVTDRINVYKDKFYKLSVKEFGGTKSGNASANVRLVIGNTNTWAWLVSSGNARQPSSDGYIDIVNYYIAKNVTFNDFRIGIQLEIVDNASSSGTEWEQYKSNSVNIDLQGNELCSNDDVKDELVIENGRAKIIKRIGKVVLDGRENWYMDLPLKNTNRFYTKEIIKANSMYCLSDYFKMGTSANSIRNDDKEAILIFNNTQIALRANKSVASTLAGFKTWLSTHNTIVYYQLATPIEIDLGEVTTLKSFDGINNISIISSSSTTFSGNYKYYSGDYGHRAFSYGDDIGFIYSDFTYPTELIGNAGDNVTTILDKIKSTLGNYEYFYEVYGNCRFQEIKNYLNTKHATTEIEKLSNNDYLVDMSKGKVVYELDNSLGISYSNNPQYMNIKNDYIVWGTRKTEDGVSIPIRYHLAIDKKPKTGNIYNCFFYLDPDDGLEKATIPIEYQSRSNFPKVGVNKTYYLDKSTNVIYMWDGKTESYLTVSGLETKGYSTLSDFPSQGDSEKIYVDQSNSNRYTWAIDQQSSHYLDVQNQKKSAYLDYINTIAPLEDKISQNEEDIKKDQSILEEIGTTEQINAAIADVNADITIQQTTVNMIKQEIATLKEEKEQATSEEEKQMIQTEIDNYTMTLELEEMALENLQDQLATLQGYLTQRPILEQEILDKQEEIESLSEKIKNAKTLYDNKIETLSTQEYEYVQIENKELTKVKTTDWRTELYLQGVMAEPLGVNSNYYYAELAAEWPRIYNLRANSYTENGETIYTGDFYQEYKDHPETLPYFLDFIDSNAEVGKFSVSNIGRRSLVESSNDYNCVFEPEIPDLVLIESGQDDTAKKRQECENKGQAYIQVPSSIYNMLALGGSLNSCYVRIKDLLYNHTKYNESIQIQCLPIYQIEPNTRIRVRDVESNISGDYIVNTISIPFTPNGTMSISATRALEKL